MKKLYSINVEKLPKFLDPAVSNKTCRAIIKTLYRMSLEPDFKGSTGDEILEEAVKRGLWTTNQARDKYHTTFAYYKKKLEQHGGLTEVGSLGTSTMIDVEQFLELNQEETNELNIEE